MANKPKVFEKPIGVKDYVPSVVRKLRRIEADVLDCMRRWGYEQIMTPTLEYYDTVGAASSTSDEKLFKLLDRRGNTLVLRSDMTAPIARVAASVLREEKLPLRMSYHANVFRAMEEEAGRDAEFYQTGVELVGDDSPEADAEIIALAIASLQAAGIDRFKIAVGHVGYLNGLFEEKIPDDPELQHLLKQDLVNKDQVGYLRRVERLAVPEKDKTALETVWRLRGREEVFGQAAAITNHDEAKRSIVHLRGIWDALADYGVQQFVVADLTMVNDISYYTGMTFEGFTDELGFPVCNGGRYDRLLQQFGRPAPATGFALKTNRILEVIGRRSDSDRNGREKRILIAYEPEYRKQAFAKAAELRRQAGFMVETKNIGNREQERADITDIHEGSRYDEVILLGGKGATGHAGNR